MSGKLCSILDHRPPLVFGFWLSPGCSEQDRGATIRLIPRCILSFGIAGGSYNITPLFISRPIMSTSMPWEIRCKPLQSMAF